MSEENRVVELLEELVKWTKVTSIPKVKELLLDTLSKPEEKVAYELSDGKAAVKIAKKVGVSDVTVGKWWKKWVKIGIAETIAARGGTRAKRTFSLAEFDIEVPSIKISSTKEGKSGGKKNE